MWVRTAYIDMQPPHIKRQPGRSKKKRTKDPSELLRDESQMKRVRYGIECRRCKEVGHNKSTCKLPPPPPHAENQVTDNPSSNQLEEQSHATGANQTTATTTNTVIQQLAPTHITNQLLPLPILSCNNLHQPIILPIKYFHPHHLHSTTYYSNNCYSDFHQSTYFS